MTALSATFDHSPAGASRGAWAWLARNSAVVALVLALHAAALWAMANGQARPETPAAVTMPQVISARLIAATVAQPKPAPAAVETPPPPIAAPEPPAPPVTLDKPEPVKQKLEPVKAVLEAEPIVKPVHKRRIKRPAPVAQPAPEAVPAEPEQIAPSPASEAATAAVKAPTQAAVSSAPEPAPVPKTVLPSSSAAYLDNAPPPYPPISRRLRETGRVVIRVLIGTDGRAHQARIVHSSGYERLDQAALATVRDRWRYVPGTRGGVPTAMWFDVPIQFVLE